MYYVMENEQSYSTADEQPPLYLKYGDFKDFISMQRQCIGNLWIRCQVKMAYLLINGYITYTT